MSKRGGAVQNGTVEVANGHKPHSTEKSSYTKSSVWRDVLKLASCLGSGAVFGFAMEKSGVVAPSVIQNQMTFSQLTMLKVFLSAVTAGLGSFALLSLLPLTQKLFVTVRESFGGCVSTKRLAAFVLGGTLLGMGMTISGACPGTVILQLGAGTQNSLITLAGCFTGAALYGLLEPSLRPVLYLKKPRPLNNIWLDKVLSVPYISAALVVALLLGGVILAAEYSVPWTTDSVPVSPSSVGVLAQKTWSPILAGLLMGSLQLSVALTVGDSLGGSSSYCTLLSNTFRTVGAQNIVPYFNSFASGIGNWWQVVYWMGAALGTATSAYLSGTWGTTGGVTPLLSFLGGFFVLFGARMASGCTSGHGLSGLALLSLPSFLAVPAMFAGGIGLAFARKML